MDKININNPTPEIGPYTKLTPFRFWCQKVLPLVYDESLSYYELLCKVVDYLNKTMEDVDNMIDDMGDFRDAYADFTDQVKDAVEELEGFVNDYFDNLDVQEEINNKLDAMAEAGYFDTLFNTLFRNDIIAEAGNVTSAWIAENLLQETGYVIDKSLTVADAAADAKVVGEIIRNYNSYNILDGFTKTTNTSSGITWTWTDNKCEVTGTASANTFDTIYQGVFSGSGLEIGKKYFVKFHGNNVHFRVYFYTDTTYTTLISQVNITNDIEFVVPAGTGGIMIRLTVSKNAIINETVQPELMEAPSNTMLADHTPFNYADHNKLEYGPSIDDIKTNSIIFVSTSGGVPDLDDYPLSGPGWLETTLIGNSGAVGILQRIYPWNMTENQVWRTCKNGTWGNWKFYGETRLISQDTYNNTYNITTSPTITTDSNGWLQPVDTNTSDETGKTDMTGAIMSMLNDTGYCHLAPGIYYVSGSIDMPADSMIVGCGKQTIIRLLQSVESGYIIRMHTRSTLKNVCLSGGYSAGDISDGDIGGRKGINYIGNRDGNDPGVTPAKCTLCQIEGCYFENLDSGFYGYNAGGGLQEGVEMSNCYFTRCKAGINIDYWTEYCKFVNCVMFQCYYACINNGGNNVFVNCTFHGVIGFLIDNSGEDKQNNAHGSVIGCTFNHINNMNNPGELGKGLGIKILGPITAGFMFANCQMWYGRIYIEDAKGIQINGFEFGGIGGATYPVIDYTGTDTLFVNNCLFQSTPTLEITGPSKFVNCWTYDGTAVTA